MLLDDHNSLDKSNFDNLRNYLKIFFSRKNFVYSEMTKFSEETVKEFENETWFDDKTVSSSMLQVEVL
jgi:hypothetical protein